MSATCSDVERALVWIPKGTVRRRVHSYRHRVRLQNTTLGIPDIDHRARTTGIGTSGGHNIPLSVQAHTINTPLGSPIVFAKLMQHDIVTQRAVVLNIVRSEFPSLRAGLDHIQGVPVRRDQQAVRPGRIGSHTLAHPGPVWLGVGAQDRVTARYLLLAGHDVARIPGITEPDAALAVNRQIVWGVEWLAVQLIHNGRRRAIGLEAHNGPSA